MRSFNIKKPDDAIRPLLQRKIDNLVKPPGSLGALEDMAIQVGWVQQSLNPVLNKPHHILFTADHGIVDSGVSPSSKEVTWQQALNFVEGGGGINFLVRQHGFDLLIVDSGVDYDFENAGIINRKIRKGSRNFLYEAAMTEAELNQAIESAVELVDECHQAGCNIISIGELGIANTSASSMWMSYLTGIDLKECVGAGSGWATEGILNKYKILQQAMDHYQGDASALDIMRYFGGYEMVMAVGAMLRAAELGMTILIDGFIMTNCILMASQFNPNVLHYAIFGHQGEEIGHKSLLNHMKVQPLLQLQFRLGEGSGAICAFPIIDSGIRMINEMKSFANAAVTQANPC